MEISGRAKVQLAVLKVLMVDGEMSTSELVEETGCKGCYSACRALEEKTLLKSKMRRGGRIFWDTYTRLVLTRDTYDEIMSERASAKKEGKDEGPIIPIYYYVRYWWFNDKWVKI